MTRSVALPGALLAAIVMVAAVPDPEPVPALSSTARAVIGERMHDHGVEAARLLDAVVRLRRADVQTLATALSNEARLARPVAGDTLNAQIPPLFFDLQDAMRRAAGRTAEAARGTNDEALAAAFGELVSTCVRCHSAYRLAH